MYLLRHVLPLAVVFGLLAAAGSGRAETDPASVVAYFCRLDAEGKRMTAESFPEMLLLASNIDVARDGRMVVIAGYKVGRATIDRETAIVPVEYDELGAVDALIFARHHRKQSVTFRLIHTASGWIIADWVAVPRVLGSAAIDLLQTSAPDRRAVEQTVGAIRHAARDNALPQ